VQRHTDDEGGEVGPQQMWDIFAAEYFRSGRLELVDYDSQLAGGKVDLTATIRLDGAEHVLNSTGNGPIDAFVHALSSVDVEVRVLDYAEHALTAGENARAAAYVECSVNGETYWGVGVDPNILTASLRAVVSAVNRHM
jgi:2-isopropylmalate synthase